MAQVPGTVTQVSIGTAPTPVITANLDRKAVLLTNITGTQPIYLGFNADLTTANGQFLKAAVGAWILLPVTQEIWGLASSAQTVSVLEVSAGDLLPLLSASDTVLSSTTAVVIKDDAGERADVIALAGSNGLAVALVDTAGAHITTLPVSLASVPSHAVTNAGTFAVQTGAERAEDTAHTTGDTGLFILGVMNEGEATIAPTQGDYAPIAVNETGQVMVEVRNSVVVAPAGGTSFTVANTSINGPGAPTIDSYQSIAINLAAGADQVLVASAANKQIWVYGLAFTVNVAGTVSFQDQDDAALSGIMQFGDTGGMVVAPSGNFAMPLWKLGTDKDLEADVVTSELDGTLTYAVVSV